MIQKVFAKEPRVLKKWNAVSRYWKFNNDKLTVIIEADPVTTTEQSAKELNINHCMVIQHLKQTGKVKKLHKHISELTTIQKYQFWSVIFFPGNNKEPYLKWIVIWDEKWICTTTSSVAGPRSSNVWQSTVWLLQLSESWQNHIWEVCAINWWDAPIEAYSRQQSREHLILLHSVQ